MLPRSGSLLNALGCFPVELELTLKNICSPSKDVVTRELEGRMLIMPVTCGIVDVDGEIFTLSETGRAIWHKLNGEKSLQQIAAELAENFTCPQDQIEKDVLGIVTEMIRWGICLKINGKQEMQQQFKGIVFNCEEIISTSSHAHKTVSGGEPPSYIASRGELCLSNPGQLALLKSMAEHGVPLRSTVRGFSMHPFIRDGDILTIAPLKDCSLDVGDIVAFTRPVGGRLAIHRIIKQADSGWLLKGDNCQESDGVVPDNEIIGRVIRVERNKRKVHLGLGASGKLIAILNNCKGLGNLKKLWSLPRRSAGSILRRLQSVSLYRVLARRFMPPVIISQATDSDLQSVHRRFNPWVPYRRREPNPNVTNLVAAVNNKVVGFAQLVYRPEDHFSWSGYWLHSLHVWSLYRGLGIGEKLVRQHIEDVKKMNASELLLTVYEDNTRAIKLNLKLGFKPIVMPALEPLLAEEKDKSGRKRIVMKKMLR